MKARANHSNATEPWSYIAPQYNQYFFNGSSPNCSFLMETCPVRVAATWHFLENKTVQRKLEIFFKFKQNFKSLSSYFLFNVFSQCHWTRFRFFCKTCLTLVLPKLFNIANVEKFKQLKQLRYFAI